MKQNTGRFLASLVLTVAWLATGSTAGAVAPMPYSPELRQEPQGHVKTVPVLPEWAFADLASSPRGGELGVGYFASSVDHLTESPASRAEKEAKAKKEKKAKKAKKPKKSRGGTPSEGGPGDWPVLTEPPGHAYGKEGPSTGGEAPEPPGSALFAIAMAGFLVTLRNRRPR